jgi:hypothetical protein
MTALDIKSVNVAGRRLRVKIAASTDNLGTYSHDDATIQLHPEQSQASAKETLRHEMLHATLAISGVGYALPAGVEEALVRALDSIFFPAWETVETKLKRNEKPTNRSGS